ncbi:NAD(P)/FAD-dependent oxidoreductase, partial [Roseomonas sp. NPKOSM-4]
VAAAERGHRVTLFGTSLGGAAALHARLPGCDDIGRAIAHLEIRAEAAGVAMRLGRRVDAAEVLEARPDAAVLATGAAMQVPPGLEGALDLRHAVAALLASDRRSSRRALLLDLDATPATYDAAELLAERFAGVVIVTPRDAVARDSPLVVAQGILRRLAQRRVTILTCRTVARSGDGTAELRHVLTGEVETLQGLGLVAVAGARVPRDALAAPL